MGYIQSRAKIKQDSQYMTVDTGAGNVLMAFSLTLLAGLATGIGSVMAFFSKRTNAGFLCLSLGFSAGVMIYVSFAEILRQAGGSLAEELGAKPGAWVTTLSFFGGILLAALIDKAVPKFENPHETRGIEEMEAVPESRKLLRMGVFSAIAIGVHNFPEGLATFMAGLKDPALGISTAVAIAIHNIPEGIAVSVPLYFATGSKGKAFTWSFVSGLAEPAGAAAGFFLLFKFLDNTVFGIVFAAVAGIMVFISLDELLPAAEKYGEHHVAVYGLLSGMGVMALSLLLLM
jgi:ZIP family zinc transporter